MLVADFSLATLTGNRIVSKPEQFNAFTAQIKDFATPTGQTIKSASKLAGMMANKAKLLAISINEALTSDEQKEDNSTLKDQLKALRIY